MGWATSEADIQAPLGFDLFGYSYRDVSGSCVHGSVRNDSYGEGYEVMDVIGTVLEIKEGFGIIHFYKNGKDQGEAYRFSWKDGDKMFPSVSLYQGGKCRGKFIQMEWTSCDDSSHFDRFV